MRLQPRDTALGSLVWSAIVVLASVACTESNPITSEPPPNDSGANADSDVAPAEDAAIEKPLATACPTGFPGAPLVRLPAPDGSYYCMDQREVTNAEYAAFLAAKGGEVSGQPKECEWNQSYTPKLVEPDDEPIGADECPTGSFDLEQYPDHPVRCVDFCDAFAYCKWAGKHLCGQFGTESDTVHVLPTLKLADGTSAATSEWYNACSQGGVSKYPYGDEYVADRCGGGGYDRVTDVSDNLCKGMAEGFDQVFDLSGSLEEWVNLCKPDACAIYGGAFSTNSPADLACDKWGTILPRSVSSFIGFRCCADAVPPG